MTTAPAPLKEARSLLLEHLDIHENSSAYSTDLDPAEVGIVGDPAHWGGYHCGSDRVTSVDYSVDESSRDRNGLTLDASALDVGQFSVTVGGQTHNLRTFSRWVVSQCEAGAPDTRDIREVIYSPDGEVVQRWDRLKRRTTGDSSHLWHTHFSFHRDAIKAGRGPAPLFRRYLATIGLIQKEDTMSADDAMIGVARALAYAARPDLAPDDNTAKLGRQVRDNIRAVIQPVLAQEGTSAEELTAALATNAGTPATGGSVDLDALADLMVEKLAARMAS